MPGAYILVPRATILPAWGHPGKLHRLAITQWRFEVECLGVLVAYQLPAIPDGSCFILREARYWGQGMVVCDTDLEPLLAVLACFLKVAPVPEGASSKPQRASATSSKADLVEKYPWLEGPWRLQPSRRESSPQISPCPQAGPA